MCPLKEVGFDNYNLCWIHDPENFCFNTQTNIEARISVLKMIQKEVLKEGRRDRAKPDKF